MKPPRFGSRQAIPIAPAEPRALLQTKLMGSLLSKTLPEPALQPLDNVMALPCSRNGTIPLVGLLNGYLLF